MKKLYSKRLGKEAYALDAAQLDIFRKSGYETPTAEAVIADAGAAAVLPPKDKRAYVVFNYQTGVFSVRAKSATLKNNEVGAFVGEVVQAALLCRFLENADPDRPKADTSAASASLSPLANMLKEAFLKAAQDKQTAEAAPGAVDETPEDVSE